MPEEASLSETLSPREAAILQRVDHIGQRADWAWDHKRWGDAADAYDTAVKLLIDLAHGTTEMDEGPGSISMPRRWLLLSRLRHRAPRAAFAHARNGDPRSAILSLERIGGVVGAVDPQRRMLERLRNEGHDKLWRRFVEAIKSLGDVIAANQAIPDGPSSKAEETARAEAMLAAQDIRRIPGFERFSVRARWSDVSMAAALSPLVYLAMTSAGTVAVVWSGGESKATLHFADSVTPLAVETRMRPFLKLEVEHTVSSSRDAFEETHRVLHELVDWLVENLLLTVRIILVDARSATLVTGGLLSLLPLAAGIAVAEERLARSGARLPALGTTIAPSARSYCEARERAGRSIGRSALLVMDPRPISPLYEALEFGDSVKKVVGRLAADCKVLSARAATVENVFNSLPSRDVVVFWCHGEADRRLGYSGVLLLADHQVLSVLHLAGNQELGARLVILGACRSGLPVMQGGDEVITLATAFLGAGACCVLSTLWRVDEVPALLVVSKFLEAFEASGDAVEALRAAQAWVRRLRAIEVRAFLLDLGVDASQFGWPTQDAADNDLLYEEYWYWGAFQLTGA
jgi:hypothetical protein